MNAVTKQEIVDVLSDAWECPESCKALLDRINTHGLAPPDGLALVPSKEFYELMYWLDRCDDKGHLARCPDLIDPLADLNNAMLSVAPEVSK